MSGRNALEENTRQQQLWRLADQLRSSGHRCSPEGLVIAAKEQGIAIGWEDLPFIWSRFGRYAEMVPPRYVADFLNAYFAGKDIQHVLDPWAQTGMLLTALVQSKTVCQGVGIVHNPGDLVVARTISNGVAITWRQESPFQILSDCTARFDAAISSLPFGMERVTEIFATPSGSIEIRDEKNYMLLLRSCLLLTETGEGIFIVPNAFFLPKPHSVYSVLAQFGLHVNAILAHPEGTLAPWTAVDANLVIIGRHQVEQLFVAQIDPARELAPLLDNLRKRRAGRIPELGRLVEPSRFQSWQKLRLEEEVTGLAVRSGTHPVPLADIVEAIHLGNRSENGGFADLPNVVYLPLIGTSSAVTSLTALTIKPQNAAQIVLRPEFALADYVAGFFNSTLGRKVREQLCSGTFIPKITKQTLKKAVVYLPLVGTQVEVARTQRTIHELTLQLEELQKTLWNHPASVPKIQKEIDSLNQKNAFEAWLETLPFPLASILWRYHADAEPRDKNNHLLHFFEATAQFVVTLMLSALHSDREFFKENKHQWLDSPSTSQSSWQRVSFGAWVKYGERLAKFTRRMLADKEQRERCLSLYTQN